MNEQPIHKTKYAYMTDAELVSFAEKLMHSYTGWDMDLARELLERLKRVDERAS